MNRSSVLLIVALLVGGVYSVGLKAHMLGREDPEAVLHRGAASPPFELSRLDGTRMELGQVAAENKVVLVNFWATWCQPCRIEMPLLERIYARHHDDGFEILAVSAEDGETVAAFLDAHPYSYPILLDPDGAVATRYGIAAIPKSVLIDRQGNISRVYTGLNPILEQEIERLMKEDAGR